MKDPFDTIQTSVGRHTAMVARLVKSPSAIFNSLTCESLAILHAGIGMVGEVMEIAMAHDQPHFIEEAGDCLFYIRDLMTILNIGEYEVFKYNPDHILANTPRTSQEATNYIIHYGKLALDIIKKHVIYNQPLRREELTRCMEAFVMLIFIRIISEAQLSPQDVNDGKLSDAIDVILEANIKKLTDKRMGRYPDGYSDEAAAARADKAGKEDDAS